MHYIEPKLEGSYAEVQPHLSKQRKTEGNLDVFPNWNVIIYSERVKYIMVEINGAGKPDFRNAKRVQSH